MEHACAQCSRLLTDDNAVPPIKDGLLYFFCTFYCRNQWAIRRFWHRRERRHISMARTS
ncbi:MAG TPA: hypothetical protein VMU60_05950 [Syntrophobacteria bacterium]|nr:hypothetical protein [Syntrophobacteria bacterium]